MWDHQPTAEELLSARLAAGWQPTPTELKDGPAILGYACKVPVPGVKPVKPAPSPK